MAVSKVDILFIYVKVGGGGGAFLGTRFFINEMFRRTKRRSEHVRHSSPWMRYSDAIGV